jgi:hypothetical protein
MAAIVFRGANDVKAEIAEAGRAAAQAARREAWEEWPALLTKSPGELRDLLREQLAARGLDDPLITAIIWEDRGRRRLAEHVINLTAELAAIRARERAATEMELALTACDAATGARLFATIADYRAVADARRQELAWLFESRSTHEMLFDDAGDVGADASGAR